MVRRILPILLLVGCHGRDSNPVDQGVPTTPDLSTPIFDLAALDGSSSPDGDTIGDQGTVTPRDMIGAKLNCMGVATCVYTCIKGGTDINTCGVQCSKSAKTGSYAKWQGAVSCGQAYCVGNADMMSGECVEVPVPGSPGSFDLCDPGTTYAQCTAVTYQSTSCLPCLDQARNIWIYDISVDPANPGPPTGMCSMPTSADCMGAQAACNTQFMACLNDV